MDKQPDALRLAEIWSDYLPAYHYGQIARETDAELRRQHALIAELVEALETVLDSMGALSKPHELLDRMSEEDAAAVFSALSKAKEQQ